MNNLREIIAAIVKAHPKYTKQELKDAVMAKVKKEGFYTDVELAAIEDELAERLKNY